MFAHNISFLLVVSRVLYYYCGCHVIFMAGGGGNETTHLAEIKSERQIGTLSNGRFTGSDLLFVVNEHTIRDLSEGAE
jgi:hypothetical protein